MTIETHGTAEGATSAFAAYIEADHRFMTHPCGHTKKVLRYRAQSSGRSIAIEKRKGPPTIYVESAAARGAGWRWDSARVVPAGLTGRNSNLAAIFDDAELLAVKTFEIGGLAALMEVVNR